MTNRRVRPSRCALDCSSAITLFGGRQRHSRYSPPVRCIDGYKSTTPNARVQRVQRLDPAAFEAALAARLGEPMTSVMSAMIKSLRPEASDDDVAATLHLMMLSWLMATDTSSSGGAR